MDRMALINVMTGQIFKKQNQAKGIGRINYRTFYRSWSTNVKILYNFNVL